MKSVFPAAEVVGAVPPAEFVVPAKGQGSLSRRCKGFFYSGTPEDAAALIAAARALWPADCPVVAFDDNVTQRLPVPADVSVHALRMSRVPWNFGGGPLILRLP